MTTIQKIVDYFRSAKSEMYKVSWPSRRDTVRYSALIIGLSVVVGLFFATLDYGFTWVFDNAVLKLHQTTSQQSTTNPVDLQTQEIPIAPVTPGADTAPSAAEQPAAQNLDLNNAKPIETPKN